MIVANNGMKSEKVYRHIRSLLKENKIGVDKFTEKKIIELTGFSRSPVRDSLMRLEAEGVVRFNGHRRGRLIEYIEDQNPEDVLYRYELREYIQSGAAFLAAKNFNGWQIDHLCNLVDIFEGPDGQFKDFSEEESVKAYEDFYDYLIGNCGNPLFLKIWKSCRLKPCSVLNETTKEKIKKGMKAHDFKEPTLRELAEAIAGHNAELAEKLAKRRVQMISSVLRKELYS